MFNDCKTYLPPILMTIFFLLVVLRVRSKSQGGNWGEFVFSKELKIDKKFQLSYCFFLSSKELKINKIFPVIRLEGAKRILWIIRGALVRMGAQLGVLMISK